MDAYDEQAQMMFEEHIIDETQLAAILRDEATLRAQVETLTEALTALDEARAALRLLRAHVGKIDDDVPLDIMVSVDRALGEAP